jgi:hypothetical protein
VKWPAQRFHTGQGSSHRYGGQRPRRARAF